MCEHVCVLVSVCVCGWVMGSVCEWMCMGDGECVCNILDFVLRSLLMLNCCLRLKFSPSSNRPTGLLRTDHVIIITVTRMFNDFAINFVEFVSYINVQLNEFFSLQ